MPDLNIFKTFAAFSLALCLGLSTAGAQKKVYADYHGVRYTREHDGKLGRWGMYARTSESATGRATICHNADIILPDGRHDIAAVDYPLSGMQSNLDPDFIEYQILTAKAAGIDGFFIEWGFMPHENHDLLLAMQEVAARYGFEIGVNWCEQWLYYDWITRICPEIDSRESKTRFFAQCYRYIIDNVLYNVPTAPVVNGKPVLYLFGASITAAEFASAEAAVTFPEASPRPAVLRRWAEWGKLVDGKYSPVRKSRLNDSWTGSGTIPTAWIPARVRERNAQYPDWDNYGTVEDALTFMEPFRDSVWLSRGEYSLKSGFVVPGMDNSGCAGWGRQHYYYLPRNGGDTYRRMWEFNLEYKDSLDMVLIASWSDYTEGHEIEPTERRGYRELETTLKYASIFKETEADYGGMKLPLELFGLRKKVALLASFGREVEQLTSLLDEIATSVSVGEYIRAAGLLKSASAEIDAMVEAIDKEKVVIAPGKVGWSIKPRKGVYEVSKKATLDIEPSVKKELGTNHYRGYITFSYYDEGYGDFFIKSNTGRAPKEDFEVVAQVRHDNSGQWKQARVELFDRNIMVVDGEPLLRLHGNTRIKDLSMEFEIYRP